MTYISKLVAGTKFPAPIGLTDDQVEKGIPLLDANLLMGGLHLHDTIAERNAIPVGRRRNGTLVSVWEGSDGTRPVNYILKAGVLPGTPAGFSSTKLATPVPLYEEVDETSYEPNHLDYTGTDGMTQTTTTPTGNMYAYLKDVLPDHPSATDPYLYVRVYGSGTDGWYWFYADEPVEAKDENTWMIYEEFYDANGAYSGYTGTFNNSYVSGTFYKGLSHLTATPGTAATGEQPNLMGVNADQSDVWVKLEVEAPVKSVASYDELIALRDSQLLTPNIYYAWPYRCVYQRPGSNEIVTSATEEVLMAQAVNTSALSLRVQSVNYPQDTILFEYQHSLGGARIGWMKLRRDELTRLEARYDWRAVQYLRESVAGFGYETANSNATSTGYEIVFTIGIIGSSLPTNYREYTVYFPNTNHVANPTITMTRGAGGHTTELKSWDGSSLAAGALGTLLADSGGKAYLMFSPELQCYTVMTTEPEEQYLKGAFIGIPALATQQYDSAKLIKNAYDTRLYYTFNNGYDNTDCKIEANSSPTSLPDIVINGNAINVFIGVGCREITIAPNGASSNIHLGISCSDIHLLGRTPGFKMGAGSSKVLLAGDGRYSTEVLPRSYESYACTNNAYFLSYVNTGNVHDWFIRHDKLENTTIRNRSGITNRMDFGTVRSVAMNINAGWDKMRFDFLESKSFEFASRWSGVTYVGAKFGVSPATFRNIVENTVVIEGDNLFFPAAASSAEKRPLVIGADGKVYKWEQVLTSSAHTENAEGATASTLAKRDATGGLTATEFTMTSDARLKTDLERITPAQALEIVRQLPGYFYRRNDIVDAPLEIGYLAQEVEALIPQLTRQIPHEKHEDALGVNYARAVALLSPAVQALHERIVQLEKQLQ